MRKRLRWCVVAGNKTVVEFIATYQLRLNTPTRLSIGTDEVKTSVANKGDTETPFSSFCEKPVTELQRPVFP